MSRRRGWWGLAAGVALLAGCAGAPGVPDPPREAVERPEWRVGDRWLFRRTTAGGGTIVVTHTVTAVTPDGYTMRVGGGGAEVTRLWTADLHLRLSLAEGRVVSEFQPAARYFAWPLTLGKTWTQEFEYRDGQQDGRYVNSWQVEEAVESVDVLAGSFYALRIEHRGGRGERLETYWYVPRVRYWIKLEHAREGYVDELVEFTAP